MALAPWCDLCGYKFLRDISKFCANCGEKRMVQEAVEEEEDLEVDDEGRMRGPPASVALQEKSVNTLSYMQIFAPPTNRKNNKKYGKKALVAAKMDIQHRILLDNYEQVKKWLVDAQEVGRLPQGAFNLEEEGVKERLREIIKENCPTLQELKLGTNKYKWDEREVYKFLKKHLKYLRRKRRISEKLTRNEVIEGQEINDASNNSLVEKNRNTVQPIETLEPAVRSEGEGQVPETEPTPNLGDDESFYLENGLEGARNEAEQLMLKEVEILKWRRRTTELTLKEAAAKAEELKEKVTELEDASKLEREKHAPHSSEIKELDKKLKIQKDRGRSQKLSKSVQSLQASRS